MAKSSIAAQPQLDMLPDDPAKLRPRVNKTSKSKTQPQPLGISVQSPKKLKKVDGKGKRSVASTPTLHSKFSSIDSGVNTSGKKQESIQKVAKKVDSQKSSQQILNEYYGRPQKPVDTKKEDFTRVQKIIKSLESNDSGIKVKGPKVEETSKEDFEKDRMNSLKEIVAQNGLGHKIFAIFDNHRYIAGPIREELLKRGWLEFIPEKKAVPRRQPPSPSPAPVQKIDRTFEALWKNYDNEEHTTNQIFRVDPPYQAKHKTNTNIYDFSISNTGSSKSSSSSKRSSVQSTYRPDEAKVISQLIQSGNHEVNFVWLSSKPDIQLTFFQYVPETCSKFQKTVFCSKIGLWYNLRYLDEFKHQFRFPVQSPRMYNIADAESRQAFLMDFRMTAAISILRWLIESIENFGVKGVRSSEGEVPIRPFEFALRKCEKFVKFKQRKDRQLWDEIQGTEVQWRHFLSWFYAITNDNMKIRLNFTSQAILAVKTRAMKVITNLIPYWPGLYNDGRLNIWIMKPYSASCGRGIYLTNNIHYIEQQQRFIAQKYIEKPLLIQNTKFDIRQWFMVTGLKPLEVWMYKESYLRFCSQPFDLFNLHESVHLSNNAVQRKYANTVNLRSQNMWDSNTFQKYLADLGQPDLWKKRIYPGMRDGIVSALLCCQHTFDKDRGKGWFEIYGADFMLSANFKETPWLIEMNEGPALDPSTPVTARLCPQMLRDVIKVVVDYKRKGKKDTGGWELVYLQKLEENKKSKSSSIKSK